MTDRRSTTCRKWRVVSGKRTPCALDRDHEGLCSWDVRSANSLWQNVGPYEDVVQVMRQFGRWSATMQQPHAKGGPIAVMEGAMIAAVRITPFEAEYLATHGVDPVLGTIIAGMLIRAAHPGVRLPVEPVDGAPGKSDTPS